MRTSPIAQNGALIAVLAVSLSFASVESASAQAVALQNATATFSQTLSGDFSVARAINGINDNLGWAIFDTTQTVNTSAQTAAFETVSNAGFAGGTTLTFNFTQTFSLTGHLLGRFRLSLTTDDRSTFADGLINNGDVTANWTVLAPTSLVSANGSTLSVLGDSSILASGINPGTDTYTILANTNLTGITGIRLEVLEDASLPTNGPGRFSNGNFVLSELTVSQAAVAVPEVSPLALLSLGGAIGLVAARRKRTAR